MNLKVFIGIFLLKCIIICITVLIAIYLSNRNKNIEENKSIEVTSELNLTQIEDMKHIRYWEIYYSFIDDNTRKHNYHIAVKTIRDKNSPRQLKDDYIALYNYYFNKPNHQSTWNNVNSPCFKWAISETTEGIFRSYSSMDLSKFKRYLYVSILYINDNEDIEVLF